MRGKKDPKIQVIDKEVFETPIESIKTPTWNAFLDGQELDVEDIKTAKEFKIVVDLELLVSGKAIAVKCNQDRIEISVGKIYFLGIWTLFSLDIGTIQASFDCQSRKLTIIGTRKQESIVEETSPVKLNPISLSSNDLLYDII